MQDDIDDFDEELNTRIRYFLAKDVNFREPQFDPAPYLIKVLKEKQGNHDGLIAKQEELITLENQAQELVTEAVSQKSEDFFGLLDLPKEFGGQLQKLKHGMAKVKKKVKETKNLLMATQKDIKQIHLNCMFNKLIYQKLKEVELKEEQYETAALALKNHMYLDCATNLPAFEGNTVLQMALTARTENLKLRFQSQAIQEVRMFLYFTPRLSIPVKHSFIDRNEDKQNAFNQMTHSAFYQRYQLFCKAKCEDYLSAIWSLTSLEERTGKVATIDGIVKGIMRIGKAKDITDSLSLDCKKSISNIFTVLFYFFAKDMLDTQKQQLKQFKKPWLTSPDTGEHIKFLSALFNISAALIRKMIIVRRICREYQLNQVCERLSTDKILTYVRDQISNFVGEVYFPEDEETHEVSDHPLVKVRQFSSFNIWPYFKSRIENCLAILTEQLNTVQKALFDKGIPDNYHYFKPFGVFQRKFNELFHLGMIKQIESMFPEGRGLIPESYDNILATRRFKPQEIQFCTKYITEDRKSLREYVNLISLLTSMKSYFEGNRYDPQRLRSYTTFILGFFYLKTNSAVFRSLISPSAYAKIMDARKKDGKVINREKNVQSDLSLLIIRKEKGKVEKRFKIIEGDSVPLRNAEQLKMVRFQMEMLLYYCQQNLTPSTQSLTDSVTDRMELEIDKHEPSNYDDNVPAKLLRVWEQLIRPSGQGEGMECLLSAIYRRIFDLYITILTSVYLETGSF